LLFKGSDSHDSNSIVVDTGFDQRFMQTGKLGNGIYFTKSAEYAERHYAHQELDEDGAGSGLYGLFLNLVLCTPPTNDGRASQPHNRKGRQEDSQQLVAVQDKAQSYPLYLILYESAQPKRN